MRSKHDIYEELIKYTGIALDNLCVCTSPDRFRETIEIPTGPMTTKRQGPLWVIVIPFHGKNVSLRFKFGKGEGDPTQTELNQFKASTESNLKKIGIMFDHIIQEVYEQEKLKP